jgi:hypothetical protein
MPQFDFYSFFTQVFFVTFAFCAFYLLYLQFLLVKSFETLKLRNKINPFFSTLSSSQAQFVTSIELFYTNAVLKAKNILAK